MRGPLISLLCLGLLTACAQQGKLKGWYQHEARIKPPPTLTKATLKPQKVESPCYPLDAAIHNAEGWVQLEFSLNQQGEPVAIETKDASPEGVFERCAVEAFAKWTFSPPKETGKQRFQFLFQFRLDG